MINSLEKLSYKQALVISLLLHFVLIIFLVLFGMHDPVAPPANFAAIEVTILSATVAAEKAVAPPVIPADSPPSEPLKPAVPQPVASTSRTNFTQAVQNTKEETAAVAQAVFADGQGADSTVAVSHGSRGADRQQASNGAEEMNGQEGAARTFPKYLYGSKPAYPQAARKAGWEGTVVVRVLIDTGGRVESASMRDSSGYDILDEAAVQAVKKWRFSPAQRDGVSIASLHDVRVRFRLDEAE